MGGWRHDTGSVEDLLQANGVVLKSMECRPLQGKACPRSTLEGAVAIGAGSRVINSLIKGLVVIGDNVTIKNFFIGPDVSVGDSCLLDGTGIENTIIIHGCDLAGISLKDSMIGSCCSIHKRSAGCCRKACAVSSFLGTFPEGVYPRTPFWGHSPKGCVPLPLSRA